MVYTIVEETIKELTGAAFPPPFTIEQPATRSAAKRLFDKLNKEGIYPDPKIVYNILIENNWEEKHAKHLLKKFMKYFQSNEAIF